jgi:aminoacrylate hydrolase
MPHAGRIFYNSFGDEGLPPLVLSSGLGGRSDYWEPNIGSLSEEYRVLVYDHRGTGQSEPTDDSSIAAQAQDLINLLVELDLDEAPAFVGHAFGGLIGLEVAMRQPDVIGRIMVVNGWASLDPHTARCFDVRETLLRDSGPVAYLKAQPLFLYSPAWISAHSADLAEWESEAAAHFPPTETVVARIAAARAWNPGPARLGTIEARVMCLSTEDDALVPAETSKALADLIPNALVASMAWGGHAVNVTRPDEFNARVVDWIR